MSTAAPLLRALRPQQWIKNLFVLAALVFARGEHGGSLFAWGDDARRTLLAFLAFCLGSSAIYLVNDVLDVEQDRQHPEKKLRPIAAGQLSAGLALFWAGALLVSAVALALAAEGQPQPVAWILGAYLVLNLLYSWRLKHVVLVDAFCIAAGFLLRVQAGGAAAGAAVSHWLLLCTFFLALFLALSKRRGEISNFGAAGRASLREVPLALVESLEGVTLGITIVCYALYTVSAETVAWFRTDGLLATVPVVVFGLFRWRLLETRGKGEDTASDLLTDPGLLLTVLVWALACAAVIYLAPGGAAAR